jgi:hypothetical protein
MPARQTRLSFAERFLLQHDLVELPLARSFASASFRKFRVLTCAVADFGVVKGQVVRLSLLEESELPHQMSFLALASQISSHLFLRLFIPPRQIISSTRTGWSQTAYTSEARRFLRPFAAAPYLPPKAIIPNVLC